MKSNNQIKLMAIGMFAVLISPVPSTLTMQTDKSTEFIGMILSFGILMIGLVIFVYIMTVKDKNETITTLEIKENQE